MGLGSLVNKQIGILGLTYKAGTSTMRRAISLDIIRDLAGQGAKVLAYDPLANLEEVQDLPPFLRIDDPYEAAKDTSALVLVTEWSDLGSLDFPQLLAQMQGNLFLDTRNILDPAKMAGAGFRYLGIGRSFKGN
jgi:UDPglucose 6-dehydrogenase